MQAGRLHKSRRSPPTQHGLTHSLATCSSQVVRPEDHESLSLTADLLGAPPPGGGLQRVTALAAVRQALTFVPQDLVAVGTVRRPLARSPRLCPPLTQPPLPFLLPPFLPTVWRRRGRVQRCRRRARTVGDP